MTHRQFRTWQYWLREQWNQPSRTDHYLMGVSCEVKRLGHRKPGQVQPAHFKLKFRWEGARPPSRQTAAAISKAVWLARMTMPVRVVEAPPLGAGNGN